MASMPQQLPNISGERDISWGWEEIFSARFKLNHLSMQAPSGWEKPVDNYDDNEDEKTCHSHLIIIIIVLDLLLRWSGVCGDTSGLWFPLWNAQALRENLLKESFSVRLADVKIFPKTSKALMPPKADQSSQKKCQQAITTIKYLHILWRIYIYNINIIQISNIYIYKQKSEGYWTKDLS